MSDSIVLRLDNIEKRYGPDSVLGPLSLVLLKGELLGIRGENGAGKSTLMGIIAGTLSPSSGKRTLGHIAKPNISYVPQDIALYPTLTGIQNLDFWAEVYGVRGRSKRLRIKYLLELMNLSDKAHKRVETYSGGMKRRLNMAAALVAAPTLLLLDEPTVGADEHSVMVMLDVVRGMRNNGTSVVLISHSDNELMRICDRIITMEKGLIVSDMIVNNIEHAQSEAFDA